MLRPEVMHSCREIRGTVVAARRSGKRVGLVPTMGALHEGHLSLVRASQESCDVTVVTIFVNPTQFGPREDFDRYPRTLEADVAQLAELNVPLVFAPGKEEIYPEDFSTYVKPPKVADRLEGKCRPGHFSGVATVVLKLFHVIPSDVAFFGQKDYQQSLVIRRMVTDLNLDLEIRVCPTIREHDGLALSSRNAYLSAEEREQALGLSRGLALADQLVQSGERDASVIRRQVIASLERAGVARIEYVSLADPETMAEVVHAEPPLVALIAAFAGKTRLIDNRRIE